MSDSQIESKAPRLMLSAHERFVRESNRIEGILRNPTDDEIREFARFIALPVITIEELQRFVGVYQPNAVLRDRVGLNVRVGNHIPPRGGRQIAETLQWILGNIGKNTAWRLHCDYEMLHPFTDGNGRSGRALWAWKMREFPLGFLHHFYYQTLSESR